MTAEYWRSRKAARVATTSTAVATVQATQNQPSSPPQPSAMSPARTDTIPVGTSNRTAVASQLKLVPKLLAVAGAFPGGRIVVDGGTNFSQGMVVRMPDTTTQKTLPGFDVQVITGAVDVLAQFMSKVDADVGLVRRFVLAEPRITVDSHHRTAGPFGNRQKVR